MPHAYAIRRTRAVGRVVGPAEPLRIVSGQRAGLALVARHTAISGYPPPGSLLKPVRHARGALDLAREREERLYEGALVPRVDG